MASSPLTRGLERVEDISSLQPLLCISSPISNSESLHMGSKDDYHMVLD
jgi:hypothetical protein